MEGFFWDGRIYEGIFPLLQELRQEVARGSLSASSEELLTSGILSYYYADVFSEEDMTVVRSVEQEAAGNVMRAACELVLRLLPEAIYKPDDNTEIRDIDGYIGFLEKNPAGLKEQIYLDFNKDYFQCWLNVIGYSMAFREWRDFFYIDPDDISVVKFTKQANTNRDITSTVFTSMIDDDVYIDIHKSIKFVNEGKKLHLTIFKGE